jgi:hypothetical protein
LCIQGLCMCTSNTERLCRRTRPYTRQLGMHVSVRIRCFSLYSRPAIRVPAYIDSAGCLCLGTWPGAHAALAPSLRFVCRLVVT